jgi:putative hydrolase of the HAD superfamily
MPQKPYKHIIFDLDRTLWDFDTNMSETMEYLFATYLVNKIDATPLQFMLQFNKVHEMLWEQYRKGLLNKTKLRDGRFNLTLKHFGIKDIELARTLNQQYLLICPAKNNLFPHTIETLDYLKGRYGLHILTNGFIKTQEKKIRNCGLNAYFHTVFSSETIGYNKPDPRIFAHAINSLNARKQECIMIGDDFVIDIMGARNFGIDQVYFNPNRMPVAKKPTYEIRSMDELRAIF